MVNTAFLLALLASNATGVSISLLFLLFTGTGQAAQKVNIEASPPGTVYLKGGRAQLGNDVKTIEDMLEANPNMRNYAGGFVAETPLVKEEIGAFFLMVNEVSNEQYSAFVEDTGFRPPHPWGAEVIDVARRAYLEEQGRLRQAAHKAGEKLPEMVPFDDMEWWRESWRDCEWSVPANAAHLPVTFVDYQDARAYARWAGLRIMTEAEFQFAARGNSKRIYPWGGEWEEGRCASMELNRAEVLTIASFPDGATKEGIYDLSGNAWEWTTSKYMPYDGYKMQAFKFGRGNRRVQVNATAKWDPNKRVAVGGSVQSPRQICRVTTRRGTDRFQKTGSLGFRCAGSAIAGLDRAKVILDDIPHEFRPSTATGPVEYATDLVLGMDRWTTAEGKGPQLPAQYSIITGYSYISYIPTKSIPVPTLAELRKASLEGDLVHLGVISTDQEIIDPPIGAGTWMLAFRGAGAAAVDEPEKEVAEGQEPEEEGSSTQREQAEAALGLDTAVDTLILFDSQGQPVTSFPADRLEWGNPRKPTLGPVDRVFTIIEEEEEVEYTERWLELELFVPGKSRKGARLVLGLRFGDGVIDGDWRKS